MRKKTLRVSSILLALIACAFLPAAAAEPESSPWSWSADAVLNLVDVKGTQISPDGQRVVFTRSRWRDCEAEPGGSWADLWLVPFDGGEPRRLTFTDASHSRPIWSPDGKQIAFLSDRGGEEAETQVWVLPLAGGEARRITGFDGDVMSFEWSPDGKRLAFIAEEPKTEERTKAEESGDDAIVVDQDLRPRRLWIADAGTGSTEPLESLGDLSVWSYDWAPDGSAVAATVTDLNRTDDSYMFKRIGIFPLKGKARPLVPVVGKVGDVAWSPDGSTIAWLGGVDPSDPSPGSLFVIPAAGGKPRNLTGAREQTSYDMDWLPDSRLAVASTVGTRSRVELVEPGSGSWETVIPEGEVVFTSASWSRDGKRYAFTGATARQPNDVYAGSLESPDPGQKGSRDNPPPPGPARRLTESNPEVAGLPLGDQETIRWKAKDGLPIEGVVVKPAGFDGDRKYPLVVLVHGGPESRMLDAWHTSYSRPVHLLAERGYMILMPNYRGSTGRGVAYAKADHKDLGGKEFTDILDGIDHLVRLGWIDPSRVAMMGGSYGGYMTGLAVTRYSDRFAAGINLFGISSWESFLGQTDIPIENSLVHWDLWCYDHADLCRERSAIGNIDRANTPTLILQGEKDKRVPKPQSDELYAALRWKKVPVEYVVYPREKHGFKERAHRADALERIIRWLETYVPPQS